MPASIAITGAAGQVGQNLIPRLKAHWYTDIVAVEHPDNVAILQRLQPDVRAIEMDMARADGWQEVVVCCYAPIVGIDLAAYERNNVVATQRLIAAVKTNPKTYVVHISSAVVESTASDWYTETKVAQERLVVEAGIPFVVLRPTLMFGWFDRKHIGWLVRFTRHVPIFPIPGHGRYLRQPLYAGDFRDVIMSCLAHRPNGVTYNISGREKVDFIDLKRAVRDVCGARSAVVCIPYSLFRGLVRFYALFDPDPPFTTKQLEALVTPDAFEVIDWPGIFGGKATPLRTALEQTYCDPVSSKIVLEF